MSPVSTSVFFALKAKLTSLLTTSTTHKDQCPSILSTPMLCKLNTNCRCINYTGFCFKWARFQRAYFFALKATLTSLLTTSTTHKDQCPSVLSTPMLCKLAVILLLRFQTFDYFQCFHMQSVITLSLIIKYTMSYHPIDDFWVHIALFRGSPIQWEFPQHPFQVPLACRRHQSSIFRYPEKSHRSICLKWQVIAKFYWVQQEPPLQIWNITGPNESMTYNK